MSENGEIYTTDKNFTLPPAVTAWTNLTSGPLLFGLNPNEPFTFGLYPFVLSPFGLQWHLDCNFFGLYPLGLSKFGL